jgi:hypothetical protein
LTAKIKEHIYSVVHTHLFIGFRGLQTFLQRLNIGTKQVGSIGNASGLHSGDA